MTNTDIPDPEMIADRIVYVRQVAVQDLPKEMQDKTKGKPIYAIHADNGDRIAFVADRRTAFIVARQNEMAPVSVH